MWSTSQDVRLQLLSTKIQHNLLAHNRLSSERNDAAQGEEEKCISNLPEGERPRFYLPSSTFHDVSTISQNKTLGDSSVIYGPDVFQLDKREYVLRKIILSDSNDSCKLKPPDWFS